MKIIFTNPMILVCLHIHMIHVPYKLQHMRHERTHTYVWLTIHIGQVWWWNIYNLYRTLPVYITLKSEADFRKWFPHTVGLKPAIGRTVSSTTVGTGVDIFLTDKTNLPFLFFFEQTTVKSNLNWLMFYWIVSQDHLKNKKVCIN